MPINQSCASVSSVAEYYLLQGPHGRPRSFASCLRGAFCARECGVLVVVVLASKRTTSSSMRLDIDSWGLSAKPVIKLKRNNLEIPLGSNSLRYVSGSGYYARMLC
jgi:hypothetical protein